MGEDSEGRTQIGTGRPFADPERVGNYRVVRKVGEGGMGVVYEARQERPVRRRVALKLIHWGMNSEEVLARFESERQALALMSHPGIARVFDAGTTDEGRPYFVMEYVPGVPVTEYCDSNRLTVRERLSLFVRICDAAQHAHQKGIIHRDIKPTNVLVAVQDGKPAPTIIDFGVAKATNQRLTERTVYTELGRLIGTPEYMSPEQAEMSALDIDTRTDVYSLGVLLYELLVGALPFDTGGAREGGLLGILRMIRDEDPPRPSARLGSLGRESSPGARRRRSSPAALVRSFRGDIDWILMKALEKDRSRRYASASEFAADVTRHLNHEPVLAGPPGAVYRLAKFVRRHRAGTVAGVLVLLALVVGVAGLATGLVSAQRARARAVAEAEAAEQVSTFLVDLFEVSDPERARGESVTAREILDTGAGKIEQLRGQPRAQARLMDTIGRVYQNLGLYADAGPLLAEALAIRERSLGADDPDVAASLNNLAVLRRHTGDYDEASALLERALDIRTRRLGPDDPGVAQTLNNIATLHKIAGRYAEARSLFERSLAISERRLGDDHTDLIAGLNNLANLNLRMGEYDAARAVCERALRIAEGKLGDDHPVVGVSLNNLANVLRRSGDPAGAEPLYERALAIWEKTLGPDHPNVGSGLANLAIARRDQGRNAEAVAPFRRALAIWERALGPDHPDVALGANNLASALHVEGDLARARPLYERAIAIWEKALGAEHPSVAIAVANLAELLADLGDDEAARSAYERALRIREAGLPPDHPDLERTRADYEAFLASTREGPPPASRP